MYFYTKKPATENRKLAMKTIIIILPIKMANIEYKIFCFTINIINLYNMLLQSFEWFIPLRNPNIPAQNNRDRMKKTKV